ncbi:MAG: hypothetical protein HY431_01625 [Candidatus Levybacteria bacterium]|nr:hypothetical protein [Candidatus Levybacteria bacterium]
MLDAKTKTKIKKYGEKSSVETLKEEITGLGRGAISSVKSDLLTEGAHDFWNQLLKTEQKFNDLKGELSEGQELDVASLEGKSKQKVDIDPGLEYGKEYTRSILHYREQATRVESHELRQRVEEIMAELKRLVDTSAVLEAQFQEVATEQVPAKAGKYHLSFFEWMLSVIRSAREKIEDSGSWLKALASKKSKRQYWAMFKKHGTTFGLSNERVVATQTG